MSVTPPDTTQPTAGATSGPAAGSTTPPTRPPGPAHSGGPRSHAWPIAVIALVAWFAGVLPWLATRHTAGTTGNPWNPRNDLREALLPFHHELLTFLLTIALGAGVLAGLAPLWLRHRARRRAVTVLLTLLGAGVALTCAIQQTLAPDPDLGGTGQVAELAGRLLVCLTVSGTVAGLLLGLLTSLATPAWRTLALAPVAVIASSWAGIFATNLVTHLSVGQTRPAPSWISALTILIAGVIAGLGLATGPRPTRSPARLTVLVVVWVIALWLVWATQSAFTAARYFLESLRGAGPDLDEVRALARDILRIFVQTMSPVHAPWRVLVVAIVAGALGLVLRAALSARGAGGFGPETPAHPWDSPGPGTGGAPD